jgi:hypothetical protein
MKIHALAFLFLLACKSITAQSSNNIDKWIEKIEEIEFEDMSNRDLSDDFLRDYMSDVYNYFDLEEQYNTPLKKLNFQKTQEFKTLSDSLQRIKAAMKQTKYIKINVRDTWDENFSYNLNKKGFDIWINTINQIFDKVNYKNSIDYIRFNNLSLLSKKIDQYSGEYHQYLFVPVNTESGEKVEDENNSSYLYIFFQPMNIVKFIPPFMEDPEYHIICSAKRIILTVEDEVIYNKDIGGSVVTKK